MEVKHPRCRKCKYQADVNGAHNCDYIWFTGASRISQVKDPAELDPDRCPMFEEGKRLPVDHAFWWEGGRKER